MRTGVWTRMHVTVAAAVLAVVAVGCDGIAENIAEEAAERAVEGAGGSDVEIDVDADSGSVTVENEDGTTQIGAGSELPDALPAELPLPDGLQVLGAVSQETEDGTTVGFQALAADEFDEMTRFFDDQLPTAGWTVVESASTQMGGLEVQTWGIEGYDLEGTIVLSLVGEGEADQQTTLAVNLETVAE